MQSHFETIANFTAAREGLYQCLRDDPGNWTSGVVGAGRCVGTMRGLSAPLIARWVGDAQLVTPQMMKSLTKADFEAVFAALFWRAVSGDSLPAGVDAMIADFAFNAGVSRAARQLQQIVGLNDHKLDGNIGPGTLHAVAQADPALTLKTVAAPYVAALRTTLNLPEGTASDADLLAAVRAHKGEALVLIHALASRQEAAYRSFRQFAQFGRGWMDRLRARLTLAVSLWEHEARS